MAKSDLTDEQIIAAKSLGDKLSSWDRGYRAGRVSGFDEAHRMAEAAYVKSRDKALLSLSYALYVRSSEVLFDEEAPSK